MKSIQLFIAFAILSFFSSNAQITKGNWMVGGSGNFTSTEVKYINNDVEETYSANGVRVVPNLGYFIADNIALGAVLSYSFSNPSGDNNNGYGYGISPFAKYYFRKSDKMINPFIQASYGFYVGKSQSGDTNKSNGYNIRGGTAIFFNSSVALELTIDYDSSENDVNQKSNLISIGIGFQIHLENK